VDRFGLQTIGVLMLPEGDRNPEKLFPRAKIGANSNKLIRMRYIGKFNWMIS
jgi:hypothetical protein